MDRNLNHYPFEDRERVSLALVKAESQDYCLKGWADKESNRDGCCCCNCVHQRPITGHPWNRAVLVKTAVSNVVGWGCASPDLAPHITFFENPHGMCEMYSRKPYGHQKTDVSEL